MKNLINFFFSFDKLFKEKLVAPFFWLAIIVWGLDFFADFLAGIKLGPLAWAVGIVEKLVAILLALVVFRILSEIAIAIFRINDNLSPDGGKSELADIDPMAEARKAAEAAASKARDFSKTAGEKASAAAKTTVEKTKSAAESVKDSAEDVADAAVNKTRSASASVKKTVKAEAPKKRGRPAGSKNKTTTAKKPAAKATPKPKTKSTAAPKKRGRPAGSKNKTTTTKRTTTAKTTASGTAPKKRGPKPGSKAPRDAQGRLLKKDGTLRGKPGPKKK